MARDKYVVNGNTCTHTFEDFVSRETRTLCYWVPDGGGYVRYTNSAGQSVQPTHRGGATWRARNGEDIRALCKSERRRQRADWRAL